MTTVSVLSDAHLEFSPLELPGGDILLLCGDTLVAKHLQEGEFSTERRERYEEFCAKQLSKYGKVLAISGQSVRRRTSAIASPASRAPKAR